MLADQAGTVNNHTVSLFMQRAHIFCRREGVSQLPISAFFGLSEAGAVLSDVRQEQ